MSNNKSELKVIKTEDGSFSIYNTQINETYHSTKGALQEAIHVYLNNGFYEMNENALSVLEIGLGTGLNAALTLIAAAKHRVNLSYTALEPYPLSRKLIAQCAKGYDKNVAETLNNLAALPENKVHKYSQFCTFQWHASCIQTFNVTEKVDLIYFDAFSPDKQSDIWTLDILSKLYRCLNAGGRLTTYCAKGEVKRLLKQAGFLIRSVPGPPGKREMTVAIKHP